MEIRKLPALPASPERKYRVPSPAKPGGSTLMAAAAMPVGARQALGKLGTLRAYSGFSALLLRTPEWLTPEMFFLKGLRAMALPAMAVNSAVSVASNAWRVSRQEISPGRAVGNVVADSALGTGGALVASAAGSAVATQLIVKAGPISAARAGLVGAAVAAAGYIALDLYTRQTGWHAAISDAVTREVEDGSWPRP